MDDTIETEDMLETAEEVESKEVENTQEEEKEHYGKKVEKRISKLVSQRNSLQNENGSLREQLKKLQSTANDGIDTKIAGIRQKKMEHMESGEFEEAESLNDEILDLKIKQAEPEKPQETINPAPISQAQNDWVAENAWFKDRPNSPKSKYAGNIFSELVDNEGFDPTDKDTYAELNQRMGISNKKPEREIPPAIPLSPDRGEVTQSNKSVKFTKSDQERMMDFGLDPSNAKQRKAWLENKQ